jgi:rSAM/selenodomain-associated transferase 2
MKSPLRASVVIPALNEAAGIAAAVASVRRQGPHEILVADGGSSDATAVIARPLADRVLMTPRGRAAQMNAGAAAATGDALLFLHADCTLEPGAVAEAVRLLATPGVAAGCFTMRVAADGFWFRSIDGCATGRVRLTGIPYGDQGLFVTRETFDRAGGFPPVRFLEDVLLGLRLRRLGRVVVARPRVVVSARRWQKVGVVRQTLVNWGLTALAAAGVPPDRLADYYANVR